MPKILDPNSAIAEIRRADLLALQARNALLEAKLNSAPDYLAVCAKADALERKLAEKESLPASIVTTATPLLRATEIRAEVLRGRRKMLQFALKNVTARGGDTAQVKAQINEIEQTLGDISKADISNRVLAFDEINELIHKLRGEKNRASQVGDAARVAECHRELVRLRQQRKQYYNK